MKSAIGIASVVMIVAGLSSSLSAQWPKYPTKSVPRNAEGTVDMNAPAPRTADGKPDLSGNWVRFVNPGGRGAPAPAPPPGTPPVATFGEVGSGLPEGLPFTPWAAELKKQRMAVQQKDNPDALCLPMGFMQFHTHGQPRKMIQTPDLVTIIYEANYGLRFIHTDGRALPPQGEPQPWWYGYSVGRWEGDTLVVETNNLRGDGWLDVRGSPFTEQAKLTERFRRVSFGKLEIDVTIDDPKAYTKPFTVRVNQQISVDNELIEFICNENQQFRKLIKID
jgi:hypothetical protein